MRSWVIALFTGVVVVALLAGLALTGLPPFQHPTSSSSLGLLTYGQADGAARGGGVPHPMSAWTVEYARGFQSMTAYSVPMITLWGDDGGNLTCSPPQFSQSATFTIAGYPVNWSAGVAPTWLFEFQNAARTSLAVVAVIAGSPVPLWTVNEANPSCDAIAVPDLLTNASIDSPEAAATAWINGGSAFVSDQPEVTGTIDVTNGSYAIHYTACRFGGPGSVSELTVQVDGATGAFEGSTGLTIGCQASSGLPEGGGSLPPSGTALPVSGGEIAARLVE